MFASSKNKKERGTSQKRNVDTPKLQKISARILALFQKKTEKSVEGGDFPKVGFVFYIDRNGEAFEGAEEMLRLLQENHIPILFITDEGEISIDDKLLVFQEKGLVLEPRQIIQGFILPSSRPDAIDQAQQDQRLEYGSYVTQSISDYMQDNSIRTYYMIGRPLERILGMKNPDGYKDKCDLQGTRWISVLIKDEDRETVVEPGCRSNAVARDFEQAIYMALENEGLVDRLGLPEQTPGSPSTSLSDDSWPFQSLPQSNDSPATRVLDEKDRQSWSTGDEARSFRTRVPQREERKERALEAEDEVSIVELHARHIAQANDELPEMPALRILRWERRLHNREPRALELTREIASPEQLVHSVDHPEDEQFTQIFNPPSRHDNVPHYLIPMIEEEEAENRRPVQKRPISHLEAHQMMLLFEDLAMQQVFEEDAKADASNPASSEEK